MPNPESSASDKSIAPPARRPKRRWPRIVLGCVLGLVLVVLLAAGAGVLWLRSAAKAALPVLDGDLHLAGLSAPVMVRRDAHGVPHIYAATEDDLFFAQGYVTAQDRLWQMDVLRRSANGDLAEVLGNSLVRHDLAQRVFQFRNTAQRIYANLAPPDRARLDAYARGVNLFIAEHGDTLPPEFVLLRYRPKPWSGADSLSIGVTMMAQTLDDHWDVKLAREQVAAKLHNSKLEADLYPVGSWRDHPPTGQVVDLTQPHPIPPSHDDEEDDDRTQTRAVPLEDIHLLRALLGRTACVDCAPGSNEWVIAGRHTASGKPLLSNDMHLELSEPNIWYMADLYAPGFHAAGVTLVGVPFVVAGHNDHVAWGYTALYADVQDVYVEKLDGKGNYQASDGSWKPLAADHEVIHVRGGKDVTVDLQSTAHGPLMNPLFTKETRPMALKWTLYDATLNALPIFQLDTAASCADATAALSTWNSPTLNVVYSDDQGHIAYHAVGRIPLRPMGLAGVPIQDAAREWQGYIPFESLPNAFDPPSGFLATANSRVTTDNSPNMLTLEWADPYRAERIYKALQGRDQLLPQDMLTVQTDIYSEVDQELAHRFAYAIDHTAGTDDRLRKAADLMRSWDGRLSTDSAAASVVTRAREALKPMILEPKLGELAGQYLWSESNFAMEEIVMHASADWLPPGYKDWDAALTEAVRRGMDRGKAPADVSRWTYGSWHVIDLEHPLASFLPIVGRIAGTGPQPLSGDTVTVKQAGRTFGPSQRFTMDWSNIDGSTENIVLGESGNPLSPYFRDQWNEYMSGTTFALPFSPAAVGAQTRHTLRLLP
ncbi:MAG TPA: penicillin acylase family protein [Bryobacteraceae bacterium]|jgi:penicillin amidase|nr:penicillin acylase family protein [Bryobacteraceae bacterium]